MWCLCGVNISLQVTPAQKAFFELDSLMMKPLVVVFGIAMFPMLPEVSLAELPRHAIED